MIARNVHSLTKTKTKQNHDCTKSSFFDNNKVTTRQNVHSSTKQKKWHDSTNSPFIDQKQKNKIMIARQGNCLTTTTQQKQKHDGTKSSFIYKKNKN